MSKSLLQNHGPSVKNYCRNAPHRALPSARDEAETIPHDFSNLCNSSPVIRVGQFSHPFFPLPRQPQSAPPMPHEALVLVPVPSMEKGDILYGWSHSSAQTTYVMERKPDLSRSASETCRRPWAALTKARKYPPVLKGEVLDSTANHEQMQERTLPASSIAHSQKTKATKSKSAPDLKAHTRAHSTPKTQQMEKPLPPLPMLFEQHSLCNVDENYAQLKTPFDGEAMYFTFDVGVDGDLVFSSIYPTLGDYQ